MQEIQGTEYTPEELGDRLGFIIEQVRAACSRKEFIRYADMADQLEYCGISRQETYDAIHLMEQHGLLIRRRRK